MAAVWMRHPDLPEQPIEVDERLVSGHQASGWELAEAPEKPSPKKKTPPAESASENVPAPVVEEKTEPAPEKPARRRAPKESEEK